MFANAHVMELYLGGRSGGYNAEKMLALVDAEFMLHNVFFSKIFSSSQIVKKIKGIRVSLILNVNKGNTHCFPLIFFH